MKFTEEHEWLRVEGDLVVVGITEHASEQLGDVVFVELPEIGTEFSQGSDMAVIESVKAAGEVKAPVTGTVVEINESLVDDPSLAQFEKKPLYGHYRVDDEGVPSQETVLSGSRTTSKAACPRSTFPRPRATATLGLFLPRL